MKLRIDIDPLISGLSAYSANARVCLRRSGSAAALNMESFAKANRPWTDRTGMARRTIQGVSAFDGSLFSVGVEGHMPYSVFLELGFGGRYSILAPAVHHFAPQALLGFANALHSMK
ncbi:MAG: hypothetical protein IIZ08_06945 [Clostridia bacterium]|nr:hypothetical protein [Clostridia bacterium]